jgi:lysozyme family protein
MTTSALRLRMAALILDFEARRDPKTRKLIVYKLPKSDRGGAFEVAGINDRYHPPMAQLLAELIGSGKHEQAERQAISYLASYTDGVASWTGSPAVEFYLRDCAFNRGPTGAARILQRALGVETDGYVGPVTRAAVARLETDPRQLVKLLRAARETYERDVAKRDESSIFWRGLVNRWNKAVKAAETFIDETAVPGATAIPGNTIGATLEAAQAIAAIAKLAAGRSPIALIAPLLAPLVGSAVGHIADSIAAALRQGTQSDPPQPSITLPAMRIGSRGHLVSAWQSFLSGQQLSVGGSDGVFGQRTLAATQDFQARHGLEADGIAGRQTLLKAMELGFELIDEPAPGMSDSSFPPRPDFAPLTSTAARQAVLGRFDFVSAPQPGNPEAIRILGAWEAENIVTVPIPQLRKALGQTAPSSMRFHRLAAAQLQGLWADWEAAGLLDRVLTYDGAYVPRFIRGSRTTLSNHAFGTAFDINAAWNGLGVRPKLAGQRGSVRELVSLAHKRGFYWGGHFGSRADGMHFEVALVLAAGA